MRCRLSFLLFAVLLVTFFAHGQAVRSEMIVSTEWLAGRLGSTMVVDVADPASFAAGHIPGARLLGMRDLVVDDGQILNELPDIDALETLFTRLGVGNQQRIVLYSREPLLATRAWFTLDYLGHGHRTSVLDGGYARWTAEGREIARDARAFAPAVFTAAPNLGAVVERKSMRELVRWRATLGESYVLIDARPSQFYDGVATGEGVSRAGHIPDAKSIPWMQNVSANGTFLPAAELRRLYDAAGATPRRTVIVYCRTGMEASMTFFVLRYLGCDVSLYDGSFIEWTRTGDTPVA